MKVLYKMKNQIYLFYSIYSNLAFNSCYYACKVFIF